MQSEAQRNPAPQINPYLNHFFQFKNVFSPKECLDIIYAGVPCSQAHVVTHDKNGRNQLQMYSRNTKVKTLKCTPAYQWIYDRISEKLRLVNDKYYHFRIQSITNFQVLEYENTGFYHTHTDIGYGQSSLRKISIVVFLTPPEEYEGGKLILKPNFAPIAPEQGSAVFFPSYVPHEITPVTRGVRHTMVTWIIGPCFE